MRYTRFYLYGFGLVCANSMAAMFLSLYLKSQTVGESGIGGLLSVYHLVMPVVIFIFGACSAQAWDKQEVAITPNRMSLTGFDFTILFLLSCVILPSAIL